MKVLGGIIFLILIAKAYMSLKRPYELRLITLKSNGTLINCQLRILGRDHRINGTIEILEDIDDDRFTFASDSYFDSYGNGNYKLMPLTISNGKACQMIKSYNKVFIPTLNYGVNTNFPITHVTDPIPKGIYYFKDILLKPDNWPLIMPRGFMKIILFFYKDKEFVFSMEGVVQILDRTA